MSDSKQTPVVEPTLTILCPYCDAPFTAQMLVDLEESAISCYTCGPESANLKIEIKCSNCQRLVYKKEGKSYDW